MTAADLTAWMTAHRYNKSQLAEALGIARSTLDRYLDGSVSVPKVVRLALIALIIPQSPKTGT